MGANIPHHFSLPNVERGTVAQIRGVKVSRRELLRELPVGPFVEYCQWAIRLAGVPRRDSSGALGVNPGVCHFLRVTEPFFGLAKVLLVFRCKCGVVCMHRLLVS